MHKMYHNAVCKLEDACPECNTGNANQILKDEKLVFYQCRNCGYEWTPPVKVELKIVRVVNRGGLPVGVDAAAVDVAAKAIGQRIQRNFDATLAELFRQRG